MTDAIETLLAPVLILWISLEVQPIFFCKVDPKVELFFKKKRL